MKFIFLFFTVFSLNSFGRVYEQGCRVIGEDDYVKYSVITNEIIPGKTFTLQITAFEDENCLTPYLQYQQLFQIAAIDGEKINFITKEISYTPLSDETSDALNMISYCDANDWKTHAATLVTGKLCNDYQQLHLDQSWFQILKVEPDGLSMGLTTLKLDGRSDSLRPITYDLKFVP